MLAKCSIGSSGTQHQKLGYMGVLPEAEGLVVFICLRCFHHFALKYLLEFVKSLAKLSHVRNLLTLPVPTVFSGRKARGRALFCAKSAKSTLCEEPPQWPGKVRCLGHNNDEDTYLQTWPNPQSSLPADSAVG